MQRNPLESEMRFLKRAASVVEEPVDNLVSTDTDKPLSARQGKVLNETKQDIIEDLATIREGASKGETALQSESDPVYLADKPSIATITYVDESIASALGDVETILNTING